MYLADPQLSSVIVPHSHLAWSLECIQTWSITHIFGEISTYINTQPTEIFKLVVRHPTATDVLTLMSGCMAQQRTALQIITARPDAHLPVCAPAMPANHHF